MISNEVFIDSATLRENVVALARNIGYVPRSKKSSTARINFTVETGITPPPTTITLKKDSVVSSSIWRSIFRFWSYKRRYKDCS